MSKAISAKVEGGNLVITLPLNQSGNLSATGKTRVHASSHGNQATTVEVNGKPLIIGVNAYTKN